MASDILASLVRFNIAVGFAVLLAVLLRKPARALFGPRLAYALWLVLPLAGAASFIPQGSAPFPIATPGWTAAPMAAPGPAQAPAARVAADVATFAYNPAPPRIESETAPAVTAPAQILPPPLSARSFDLTAILIIAWLAGVLLATGLAARAQRRCLRLLGRLEEKDGALISENAVIGPAVLGALRPRIVLPADFHARFTPGEQRMVLAHEQAHLAGADPRVNAAVVALQCLIWFNPLIHLAARLIRTDQELACDALVLERQPGSRGAYAAALLKTQLADIPLPIGCYWPARGEHPLKERLTTLKLKSPDRPRRLTGLACVALLAGGAGYAAWAAGPETPPRTLAMQTPTPAAAQDAVSSALGAPAQPRLAAPAGASTVKAGEGEVEVGGPDSYRDNPDMARALKLANDHGYNLNISWNDRTLANGTISPGLATLAKTDPKRAAQMLEHNVWSQDLIRYGSANYAGARTAETLNTPWKATLKTADGQTLEWSQGRIITDRSLIAFPAGGAWSQMSSFITRDGDNLKVQGAFVLDGGQLLPIPDMALPAGGGNRTVTLPGGATMTFVLDGAGPPPSPAPSAQRANPPGQAALQRPTRADYSFLMTGGTPFWPMELLQEGGPLGRYLKSLPDNGAPAVTIHTPWRYSLRTADGAVRAGTTQQLRTRAIYLADQDQAFAISLESGDSVRVQSAFNLGGVMPGPDIVLPIHGGSRTVSLPGGASLTLTIPANTAEIPGAPVVTAGDRALANLAAVRPDLDASGFVDIKGEVLGVDLSGPRAVIRVQVTQASSGKPLGLWRVEDFSAATMRRMGFTDISGAEVTVRGQLYKAAECAAGCKIHPGKMSFADGRALYLGNSVSALEERPYGVPGT